MPSPAQRHRARVMALKAQAQSEHGQAVESSAYDLMLAQLAEHRRRLHSIQSVQQKIEVKRQIVSEYDAWIDAALQEGNGAQDLVITTLMIWHIDAGNYGRALEIGAYVLVHGLQMADQYRRSPAVVLIDEISGAYLRGLVPAGSEAVELLQAVNRLTMTIDAPDQARAKLKKAIGYALLGKVKTGETPDLDKFDQAALEAIQRWLETALGLDANCGVKKDLERIERRINALRAAGAQST